jgi:hypothetical protein
MSHRFDETTGRCKFCGLLPGEGCTDDWPTTMDKFERLLGKHRTRRAGWRLGGVNLMTQEVLGYVEVKGETVEVSTDGNSFCGDRIFGLTWNRSNDDPSDERDAMEHSLEAVVERLYGGGG